LAITRVHVDRESGATRDIGIEVELLDASDGRRLIAAADERDAGPGEMSEEGIDVREAFDDWAHRASVRLSALRSFDEKHTRNEVP
jgi:hypothetical protein